MAIVGLTGVTSKMAFTRQYKLRYVTPRAAPRPRQCAANEPAMNTKSIKSSPRLCQSSPQRPERGLDRQTAPDCQYPDDVSAERRRVHHKAVRNRFSRSVPDPILRF